MQRSEIEARIVEIIHREKTVDPDLLKPQTALADLGIDSLDALNILFGIEESFGISIPDEKARAIRTLDDMVGAVEASTTG